jgi:TonB family protein
MAAVAKIEAGVVELRTDVGRLYVCPTRWQRAYLRWTFRNFRILPREVLNQRQRRLIETLSHTAIVSAEAIPPSAIIGVVEGVHVLGVPSNADIGEAIAPRLAPVRAKARMVQASSQSADLDFAGCELETPGFSERAQLPSAAGQELKRLKVQMEEAGAPVRARKVASSYNHRRLWLVAVLGAAAAIVVLGLEALPLWRLPEAPTARLVGPAPPPAAITPASKATEPPVVVRRAELPNSNVPATTKIVPEQAQLVPRAVLEKVHPKLTLRGPAAAPASDSQILPQIAEAPQAGFMYPVAPNPNLVGKVLLKAVIGSDGAVKQVEVLSGDRALGVAAARAVRHWRYAPAQVDGHAVDAQTHVLVSFLGDDAVSVSLPPAR